MFDFGGKRVVVCGGSKGIGRSVALGFARAGARVSICAVVSGSPYWNSPSADTRLNGTPEQ